MSDFDFFYEEDYSEFNDKVDIVQYNASNLFLVRVKELHVEYSVNLIRKRFKQINDVTIFPKFNSIELYDYIITQLAAKAGVSTKHVRKIFIHEK